jgi:hypothetical protein
MGIPEYEAKRYEGCEKLGRFVPGSLRYVGRNYPRAKDLLKQAGAEDISSHGVTNEKVVRDRVV